MRRRLFGKYKITLPTIPIEESNYSDICVVDNDTLEKFIVHADDMVYSDYYTPIGVVVVPASHTDDGTARIMAIRDSKYSNSWGENTINSIVKRSYYPIILENFESIPEKQQIVEWRKIDPGPLGEIGSDLNSSMYINPYDSKSIYDVVDNGRGYMPSPYLEDGSKNPIYHSTENTGNIFADMDGEGNTKKIINYDNANNVKHNAAYDCFTYYTIGTQQGDWYLPSAGELGYLAARIYSIFKSIIIVRDLGYDVYVWQVKIFGTWSSTESDITLSSQESTPIYFESNTSWMNFMINYSQTVKGDLYPFLKI